MFCLPRARRDRSSRERMPRSVACCALAITVVALSLAQRALAEGPLFPPIVDGGHVPTGAMPRISSARPALADGIAEALARAASDSTLAPWQHEYMRGLTEESQKTAAAGDGFWT